jgi:hypothetical protein
MKKLILGSLFTLLILTALEASIPRNVGYLGTRKAGMGGCGVAIIDKRESLYYNPASIVDIDNALVIPMLQSASVVGVDVISNINKLSDASKESGDDTGAALDLYRKLIPTKLGYGYGTSGHFIGNTGLGLENFASHFAIGSFSNLKVGANMLNRLSPRLEVIGYFDVAFPTLTFGRGFETPKDFFIHNPKFGFTIKNINRYSLYDKDSGSETFKVEVLDMISEDIDVPINVRIGQGVGLDLGMIGDIDTFMGPGKLGLAITNISTTITGKEITNATSENARDYYSYKEQIPVVGTLGFAIKSSPFDNIPVMREIFPDATYAMDMDIISPESSTFKKIHLGMEQLYFNELMAWRIGLNQGYPTTGVNFNFGVFHAGLTYYVEEFGREIGDNPQPFYMLDMGFYW